MREQPRLLAFYGDDFTGSTDTMEVLESQGVRTVLFVQPPTEERLKAFPHAQAIGVAGVARTMNPVAMEQVLEPLFRRLKEMKPHVLQYKMCFTADSSPDIGIIGKVVEIGKALFHAQRAVPILAAAPHLHRYTAFGNHFAAYQGKCYRLDRHPSMSRHPVTPMKEADLLRHLSEQMYGNIGSFTIVDLELPPTERLARWETAIEAYDALVIDAMNAEHIRTIGSLIGHEAESSTRFVIGSSGLSLSLGAYWRQRYGLTTRQEQELEPEQVLVLSGSCSPITQNQIDTAVQQGFSKIKIDALELLAENSPGARSKRVLEEAERSWRNGQSLILYTADGPEDESIGRLHDKLLQDGEPVSASGERIGRRLGEIGKQLIAAFGIKRVVLAGGDTSGFAALSIGLDALELIQRTAPGAPLCKGCSMDPAIDGIEIALKGGQLGQPDYLVRIASGGKGE